MLWAYQYLCTQTFGSQVNDYHQLVNNRYGGQKLNLKENYL